MRKEILRISLAVLLLAGCACPAALQLRAPAQLQYTRPEMNTSGFWAGRHPYPDTLIMDSKQIKEFNERVREAKLISDITVLSQKFSARDVQAEIKNEFNRIAAKGYFLADGSVADKTFFDPIAQNINFNAPVEGETLPARFGFSTRYADQRLLPTDKLLSAEKGDIDFDELQNSTLNIATPLAVLSETTDKKWLYCSDGTSSGWVKSEVVARADISVVRYWQERAFAVVTAAKADIFLDEKMQRHYGYAQMGTRLPVTGEAGEGIVRVILPARQEDGALIFRDGFVAPEDVHKGFLAYTPRNVMTQAFKLLNAPYGWGGMHGEQDCSRFLQEVFATVGIELPRNSGAQINAGKSLARFEAKTPSEQKREVINNKAVGGITLLGMRGHIMLYLGEINGKPYVIHSTWAYRQRQGAEEIKYVIGKVTVSDLSLGQGSQKGSLLERVRGVTSISY